MADSVPSQVTCEQATALLIDYVTGELDPVMTAVLERHLEWCIDCEVFLRTYRETIRFTRTVSYEVLPNALQDRLLLTLQNKIAGSPPA